MNKEFKTRTSLMTRLFGFSLVCASLAWAGSASAAILTANAGAVLAPVGVPMGQAIGAALNLSTTRTGLLETLVPLGTTFDASNEAQRDSFSPLIYRIGEAKFLALSPADRLKALEQEAAPAQALVESIATEQLAEQDKAYTEANDAVGALTRTGSTTEDFEALNTALSAAQASSTKLRIYAPYISRTTLQKLGATGRSIKTLLPEVDAQAATQRQAKSNAVATNAAKTAKNLTSNTNAAPLDPAGAVAYYGQQLAGAPTNAEGIEHARRLSNLALGNSEENLQLAVVKSLSQELLKSGKAPAHALEVSGMLEKLGLASANSNVKAGVVRALLQSPDAIAGLKAAQAIAIDSKDRGLITLTRDLATISPKSAVPANQPAFKSAIAALNAALAAVPVTTPPPSPSQSQRNATSSSAKASTTVSPAATTAKKPGLPSRIFSKIRNNPIKTLLLVALSIAVLMVFRSSSPAVPLDLPLSDPTTPGFDAKDGPQTRHINLKDDINRIFDSE